MENHFNCIYCYTNKVNGKKYIGQAKDFIKRHRNHINHSYNKKCKAYNQYFHNAIRRYGIDNFEIKILKENLQNQDELNYWECFYIAEFDTLANNGKGYNLASGGSNGNSFAGKTEEEISEIGRRISEKWQSKSDEEKAERNRKISETWDNKSEEERIEHGRKLSEVYNNKSDEEKAEISKKISETIGNKSDEEKAEHDKKISEAMKEAWKNKSDEELAEFSRKMSEAHKEVWKNRTDEELVEIGRKISEANKGEKNGRAKKVIQKDLNGSIIKIWDYAKQISIDLGCSYDTIRNYINGKYKGKPYKGYIWEYVE